MTQVDIYDERRLTSLAADHDIVVNGQARVGGSPPRIRSAIVAGAYYCDIGAHGETAEKQL